MGLEAGCFPLGERRRTGVLYPTVGRVPPTPTVTLDKMDGLVLVVPTPIPGDMDVGGGGVFSLPPPTPTVGGAVWVVCGSKSVRAVRS